MQRAGFFVGPSSAIVGEIRATGAEGIVMPQDTKQAGGNIAATQETFRGSYDEPRGGLLGGFFGGRDMRDDKPAVMPRTPMDRFGGMAPAIGGALLGPVGALGGLALQSRRYTGIRDMFDGGGAGKAGPTFQGGPYSGLLNALGVRPRGFRDRQAGILERQQAAPTTMAGAMGGGSPAVPAVAPAAAPVTAQTPSGPIYSFPYRGTSATPATAYQPFTPLSYGPQARPFVGARTPGAGGSPMPTGMFSTPTQPLTNATLPTTGGVPGAYPRSSRFVSPEVSRSQDAYQEMLRSLGAGSPAVPTPIGPSGLTGPAAVAASQAAYADMQRRLREQRFNQLYPNMMVAP